MAWSYWCSGFEWCLRLKFAHQTFRRWAASGVVYARALWMKPSDPTGWWAYRQLRTQTWPMGFSNFSQEINKKRTAIFDGHSQSYLLRKYLSISILKIVRTENYWIVNSRMFLPVLPSKVFSNQTWSWEIRFLLIQITSLWKTPSILSYSQYYSQFTFSL